MKTYNKKILIFKELKIYNKIDLIKITISINNKKFLNYLQVFQITLFLQIIKVVLLQMLMNLDKIIKFFYKIKAVLEVITNLKIIRKII